MTIKNPTQHSMHYIDFKIFFTINKQNNLNKKQ